MPEPRLSQIQCVLLDMDGTFYLGERLLPGAAAFIETLRAGSQRFVFLTNNTSQNRQHYLAKMLRLGVRLSDEEIFTAGEASALWLQERAAGCAVFLAGTPALAEVFTGHGFRLVQEDPDWVVLGFDTTLTYDRLWKLCDHVRAGRPYLATHPDFNCPTDGGFKPDIGAMIAFVEASTGRRPDVVIGKPHAPILEALVRRTGVPVESMCMVGDRLYTDIALGAHGVMTVLVLSGETSGEALQASDYAPDLVVQDLAELNGLWRQARPE
ncbi:MAG: HAD-IIA family hydrolase [Anaerolineales bacterium]|nr:HAD-IIA family hydrolase [Anaerolineales bacterium]